MDDDDIVEIAAVIGADGAKPVEIEEFNNRHIISLMRTVKSYEKYTVDAAMKGSDEDALNALMLHPLCGDFAQAKSCYEEMKAAHKAYLPQFFKD